MLRVFSFGGGVQSMAVVALQSLGVIAPYDEFIFANVGNNAENPSTLNYIKHYALPFMAAHNMVFKEVQKVNRAGNKIDLYDYAIGENKAIPLPVMLSGGSFGKRTCTSDFKVRVIDKYLRGKKQSHVIVGLGISTDEFQRMKDTNFHDSHGNVKFGFMKALEYPLIELRLSRQDCYDIIKSVGLPIPPKSSCFFCPFHKSSTWQAMATNEPALFERACNLEKIINEKRQSQGKDAVYLHQAKKGQLRPLDKQVSINQKGMFADDDFQEDECESGFCHT